MSDIFSGSVSFELEQPLTAKFEPKKDITAYELAMLLPFLQSGILYRGAYEALAPEIQRHLVLL